MNPFVIGAMPINDIKMLSFRKKEVELLRRKVDERVQTVVQGVEGVGKTSLLNSAFDREYRIRKAKEGVLISLVTQFPYGLGDADIYNHFAEMAINSVRILGECDEREKMQELLDDCKNIREERVSASDYFEKIMGIISQKGYRVVMLVDDFEQFTSSENVTMKHHEVLRNMLKFTQYIVVTNYDLNKDSLPPDVSGSIFLMNFAGNEVMIKGWSESETASFIRNRLADSDVKFSDDLTERIWLATGGIPSLVSVAANYAYDFVSGNGTEEGIGFVAFGEENPRLQMLFSHWGRMLSDTQINALVNLAAECEVNDDFVLRNLKMRGILKNLEETDFYGNTRTYDDIYDFCCGFYATYCKYEEKLKADVLRNPLRGKDDSKSQQQIDLSVEDLIKMLKQKIDEGLASKEQLLEITGTLSRYLPDDITVNIDMNEVLSEEVLESYRLGGGYMNEFDKRVQDFLYVGIQMNRCFEKVSRPDFDYSPIYISFCKAVEMHLNNTLVAIMKAISPDAECYNCKLKNLPQDKTLMLGEVHHVLTGTQRGVEPRVIEKIKSRCKQKGLTKYDDNWWKNFEEKLNSIKDYRNNCPHCNILKYDDGKNLLILLFDNYKQNPDKSFMMNCKHLYNDLK